MMQQSMNEVASLHLPSIHQVANYSQILNMDKRITHQHNSSLNENLVQSGEECSIPRLRQALLYVQKAIEHEFSARGTVHCRSWRFPYACSSEMKVSSVLDRFKFVAPDPRHTIVAKTALLEMVVDRIVLLAEATTYHIDDLAAAPQHCLLSSSDSYHHDNDNDTTNEINKVTAGLGPITRLCEKAVQLYNDVAAMELMLENKDRILEQMDREITRLIVSENKYKQQLTQDESNHTNEDSENATAQCNSDKTSSTLHHHPSSSTPVTKSIITSCTQTDPSTTTPRSICEDCEALRRCVAATADVVGRFGLLHDPAMIATAGTSPFSCNALCLKYLRSHVAKLKEIVTIQETTIAERNEAQTRAEHMQSTIEKLMNDLERAKSVHKKEREQLETKIHAMTNDAQRQAHKQKELFQQLELQHDAEISALTSNHAIHMSKVETSVEEAIQKATAQYISEIKSLREIGTSNTIQISKLSKELLDASQSSASSSSALREATLRIDSLDQELQTAEQTIQKLSQQNASLVHDKRQLQDKFDHQAKTCNEANSRVETLLSQIMELQNAIKVDQEKLSATQTEIEIEKSRATEAAKTAHQQQEDLKTKLDTAEKWLDKAGEERERLIKYIATLEAQVRDIPNHDNRQSAKDNIISNHKHHHQNHAAPSFTTIPHLSSSPSSSSQKPTTITSSSSSSSSSSETIHVSVHLPQTEGSYANPFPDSNPDELTTAIPTPTPPLERKRMPIKDVKRASSVASDRSTRQAAIRRYLAARSGSNT